MYVANVMASDTLSPSEQKTSSTLAARSVAALWNITQCAQSREFLSLLNLHNLESEV